MFIVTLEIEEVHSSDQIKYLVERGLADAGIVATVKSVAYDDELQKFGANMGNDMMRMLDESGTAHEYDFND